MILDVIMKCFYVEYGLYKSFVVFLNDLYIINKEKEN